MDGQKKRILRGAAGGAVATAAMTTFMGAARAWGARGEPPPRKIVRKTLGKLGVHPGPPEIDAMSMAAHFGFGAAMGALFGAIWGEPEAMGAPSMFGRVGRGIGFGLAVWATSYVGVLPSIGWMPKPDRDRPGRAATMFLAHVVYGATLGATGLPAPANRL